MRQGWRSTTIADATSLIRNGVNCKQDKSGVGDKISRIETIAKADVDPKRVGYASLTPSEREKYRLHTGDILFSHINSPIHVGKTAIVDTDYEIYHGVNLLLMRPVSGLDARYLGYFLKHLFTSGYWRTVCKQSVNQASVNQKDIGCVPIRYPESKPEQHRITAMLDEAFAGIASAVESADKNLANTTELRRSYLKNIFAHEGDGWTRKTIADLGQVIMGQSPPGTSYNTEGIGVPLINGPVEFGGVDPFSETTATKYTTAPTKMCWKGDLVICVRGSTTGRMNIAGHDSCIGRGVAVIRSEENQDWLNQFIAFSQHDIYQLGTGSTFPNVSSSDMKKIIVPLPPNDQKSHIVNQIEINSSNVTILESVYQNKLDALAELKQSILKKALSGELNTEPDKALAEAGL